MTTLFVYFLLKICFSSSSLLRVIRDLAKNEDQLHMLPPNIKNKLLNLMCKRGLVTDANIGQVRCKIYSVLFKKLL